MSEKDKLHSGELYLPMMDEILGEQIACMEKMYEYNATRPTEGAKREINDHDKEYYFRDRKIEI